MCLPAADQRLHRSSLSVNLTAIKPVIAAIEVRSTKNAIPIQSCSATASTVTASTGKAVTIAITWTSAGAPESSRRLGPPVGFWAARACEVALVRMRRVCAARAPPPMR